MTTNNNHHIADDADRVAPAFACPKCGEARVDQLVWIDDDTVRCTTCGTAYLLKAND